MRPYDAKRDIAAEGGKHARKLTPKEKLLRNLWRQVVLQGGDRNAVFQRTLAVALALDFSEGDSQDFIREVWLALGTRDLRDIPQSPRTDLTIISAIKTALRLERLNQRRVGNDDRRVLRIETHAGQAESAWVARRMKEEASIVKDEKLHKAVGREGASLRDGGNGKRGAIARVAHQSKLGNSSERDFKLTPQNVGKRIKAYERSLIEAEKEDELMATLKAIKERQRKEREAHVASTGEK